MKAPSSTHIHNFLAQPLSPKILETMARGQNFEAAILAEQAGIDDYLKDLEEIEPAVSGERDCLLSSPKPEEIHNPLLIPTLNSDETHMAFYSYCRENDIRLTGLYGRVRGLRMALDEFGFGRLTPKSRISLVKSTFKNHYNKGAALYGQPQIPTKKRRR